MADILVGAAVQAVGAAAEGPMEYTVIVAMRGEEGEREFLMVQHRDRGWELPGGKIEAGEGPVHCALREFREETGHILAGPRFVEKLTTENGVCYVFTGGLGERVGAVHDNEAVRALRWCTRLPPAERLAFPDDPYDEIGARLGIGFR